MTDNFPLLLIFIGGFLIGFGVKGLIDGPAKDKPCEKTVHYLEQKVTSHAK
jgi:hypothetical protein